MRGALDACGERVLKKKKRAPAPQMHPESKIRASEGGRYKSRRNQRAQSGVTVPLCVATLAQVEKEEAKGDQGGGGAEKFEEVEEFVGFFGWRDEGKECGEGGGGKTNKPQDSGRK